MILAMAKISIDTPINTMTEIESRFARSWTTGDITGFAILVRERGVMMKCPAGRPSGPARKAILLAVLHFHQAEREPHAVQAKGF